MTLILHFRQAEALLWRSSASEICLTPVSEFQVIFIYFVAILVPWHYTLLGILPLFLLVVLLNYVLAYDFSLVLLPLGCRVYAPVSPPNRILSQSGCKFGQLPPSRCVLLYIHLPVFPAQSAAGVITPNNWQSYSCGGVQRILEHKKTVVTTVLHARL